MINLAVKSGEELNSESLAEGLNTNSAFIRKIMAKLSRAGLIKTRRGKLGGLSLLKNPKEISLRDIYLAVHARDKIVKETKTTSSCPISCSAQAILLKLSSHLESAHLLVLSRIKLSHLAKEIINEK